MRADIMNIPKRLWKRWDKESGTSFWAFLNAPNRKQAMIDFLQWAFPASDVRLPDWGSNTDSILIDGLYVSLEDRCSNNIGHIQGEPFNSLQACVAMLGQRMEATAV